MITVAWWLPPSFATLTALCGIAFGVTLTVWLHSPEAAAKHAAGPRHALGDDSPSMADLGTWEGPSADPPHAAESCRSCAAGQTEPRGAGHVKVPPFTTLPPAPVRVCARRVSRREQVRQWFDAQDSGMARYLATHGWEQPS